MERTRRGVLVMWMLLLRLHKENPQNKSKAGKKVDFLASP
jgi:hypothetical protein